jgi:hypothetical protein
LALLLPREQFLAHPGRDRRTALAVQLKARVGGTIIYLTPGNIRIAHTRQLFRFALDGIQRPHLLDRVT